MSVRLASLGYEVDAVDLADGALARARTEHPDATVRWLHLDIERDDLAPLDGDLYDLVVFRLSVAFVNDCARVLHALGRRLREGGTVLVITPLVAHTSAEKRHIALDEDEIGALICGCWKEMTTTSAADERPSVAMAEEAYGALRASAAQRGQVLIQRVSYRPTCLLPGGAVDKGESPAQGAAREVKEELGVTANVTRGLAVDWVSSTGRAAAPALKFPGEILQVFDGRVWDEDQIAAIRPAPGEIEAVEFVEPADLPALMSPGDGRRALSALRARIAGAGPALLEDGLPIAPTVLDRVGVLRTARGSHHLPFHPRSVPDGLTVRQSWVWAFAPDGRVLVLLEPDTGAACLPGGTPELADHGDPEATLIRETREEAAAELADARYISGTCLTPRAVLPHPLRSRPRQPRPRHCGPGDRPNLRPDPGNTGAGPGPLRLGPPAVGQLKAVHEARVLLGIPEAASQPVTELSAPITW